MSKHLRGAGHDQSDIFSQSPACGSQSVGEKEYVSFAQLTSTSPRHSVMSPVDSRNSGPPHHSLALIAFITFWLPPVLAVATVDIPRRPARSPICSRAVEPTIRQEEKHTVGSPKLVGSRTPRTCKDIRMHACVTNSSHLSSGQIIAALICIYEHRCVWTYVCVLHTYYVYAYNNTYVELIFIFAIAIAMRFW